MSYDLLVFDASAAPIERQAFLEWYESQVDWKEGQDYNDPARSTPALRAWFLDAIQTFPPMDGPYSLRSRGQADNEDAMSRTAGYALFSAVISVAFGWSLADEAYATVRRLAEKHRVGFFDASSPLLAVWRPNDAGELVVAHVDADEEARTKRRDLVLQWIRTDGELPGGQTTEGDSPSTAAAADEQRRLGAQLSRAFSTPTLHETQAAFRLAIGRMVTQAFPDAAMQGRRAALFPRRQQQERFRRLSVGEGWTLLVPIPTPTRSAADVTLLGPSDPQSWFNPRFVDLVEWLTATQHPRPRTLAEALVAAAATAVLRREVEFHDGRLIEIRTVTADVTSTPAEISLADARRHDPTIRPGEELGFTSDWDAWFFPLMDWLPETAAS